MGTFTSDLRDGLRISQISVAWTVIASTTAIIAGILDGSLVLIAFGLTTLLDAAGSFVLALHFRHALVHSSISSERERFALRVVSIGLMVVGVSTVIESIRRLVANEAGHGSAAGALIAAVSAIVLGALMVAKRRIARRLASDALMADSWLSATGALLAVIAVVGSLLTADAEQTWIDPVAALLVASAATVVGVVEFRREERTL